MHIIIYWHIFHCSSFHHICNIKCRLDCRYSPQNIFNAKNFNPHKNLIFLLNVPICTQGMQRTWWAEASTIIVTEPYWHLEMKVSTFSLWYYEYRKNVNIYYEYRKNVNILCMVQWADHITMWLNSNHTPTFQTMCSQPDPVFIHPASTKLKGGYTGFTLSVCPSVRPSVRLSVCGQNRVRSASSTILIGSISYLHILSNNFRRCVVCNGCFKIQKLEILTNSLNLWLWLSLLLTWDPIWLNGMGNHEMAQNAGVLVVLVIFIFIF